MSPPTRIFVACPIGSAESEERRRSDRLLKDIITPVVEELVNGNVDDILIRADGISAPGRISRQIIEEVGSCSAMIADVTGENPNVMYEVGLRQALLKPYILIAEEGQRLPFDLADFRTIFYRLDAEKVGLAQAELREQLRKALSGEVSAIDRDLLSRLHESDLGRSTFRCEELRTREAFYEKAADLLEDKTTFSSSC